MGMNDISQYVLIACLQDPACARTTHKESLRSGGPWILGSRCSKILLLTDVHSNERFYNG
jgi:hypothetical protein